MTKKSIKAPVILAILCAVGVHTVLFTDAGHRLQWAITESGVTVTPDAALVLKNGTLSLALKKDIANATKITASLGYDDGSLVLSSPESTAGIITTKNEDFSQNITITLKNPTNLPNNTILTTWKVTKVLPEIQTINLSDTHIETTAGTQSLSTEGTGEF